MLCQDTILLLPTLSSRLVPVPFLLCPEGQVDAVPALSQSSGHCSSWLMLFLFFPLKILLQGGYGDKF